MTARESFSLYIDGSGPGERARRAREKAGEPAFAAAQQLWSGQLHGPRVTMADIESALGAPDLCEGNTLGYVLVGRSGHMYCFDFDVQTGRFVGAGYRRIEPARTGPMPPRVSGEYADYLAHLAAIEATADELLQWLGGPVERDGWWPVEIWHYPDGLAIELRHGVVESSPLAAAGS